MIGLVNPHALLVIAWGVVSAAMVVTIGDQLGWQAKPSPVIPKPRLLQPGKVESTVLPEYHGSSLERTYGATVTRPLFVPTRLPAPPLPPPPPPPKPTMRKGQFQLMGTIVLDDLLAAVIKEVSSGKVRRMIQGEVVNGLRLERVETSRIVFAQYDDSEELTLKVLPSPKVPQVAAPVGKARPERVGQAEMPVNPPQAVETPAQTGQVEKTAPAPAQRPAPPAGSPEDAARKARANNPMLQGFGF